MNVEKDVVLDEIKNREKLFTKTESNNIIKEDYDPLKVNYRIIYKRRDGLYKMKDEILKELKRDLGFKEKVIANIFQKTFIKAYKKGVEKGFNSRM